MYISWLVTNCGTPGLQRKCRFCVSRTISGIAKCGAGYAECFLLMLACPCDRCWFPAAAARHQQCSQASQPVHPAAPASHQVCVCVLYFGLELLPLVPLSDSGITEYSSIQWSASRDCTKWITSSISSHLAAAPALCQVVSSELKL